MKDLMSKSYFKYSENTCVVDISDAEIVLCFVEDRIDPYTQHITLNLSAAGSASDVVKTVKAGISEIKLNPTFKFEDIRHILPRLYDERPINYTPILEAICAKIPSAKLVDPIPFDFNKDSELCERMRRHMTMDSPLSSYVLVCECMLMKLILRERG